MKLLLLNGHGVDLRVDGSKLHVKDGRYDTEHEPIEYVFRPKEIDIDNIIIDGHSGNVTLEAVKWLMKHNVQVTLLNWDGQLLTTMLPPEGVQVRIRFDQYNAYRDEKVRLSLAREFIRAKTKRTKDMLNLLNARYPQVNTDISKWEKLFEKANTIPDIIMAEGRIAGFYWQELVKIIPQKLDFRGRKHMNKPRGAADNVNCMLNYGYTVLASECLRAINAASLDPQVGFLHELQTGRNSLVYDLEEPFRFIVDLAVIKLIEANVMEKKDFCRTESYTLKLRPTGAKKLVAEINRQLSQKTEYRRGMTTWWYVIAYKAQELAHYLTHKKSKFNLMKPAPLLERVDDQTTREKIQQIPYHKWKKMGYSKGSLWYMKQNAKADKPFKLNKHILARLATIN